MPVSSVASGSYSEITTPHNGFPPNSSILDSSNSQFTITARNSTNDTAGDSETLFAELYSYGSCEVGYASASCEVVCYPYNAPHTKAPQCDSYTLRYTKSSSTGLWVVADVTSLGSSLYKVSYHNKVEVSTYYDVSAYVLTNGGLRGKYWDNIWMVDSPVITRIDSSINFNWGTGAITTYGTDYVSIRWEGKIKPPYNETYTFYISADDGARIWIDKRLIADSWNECCNEVFGSVTLVSYKYHDIIVEYREIRGQASMELRWESASIAKTIVPSTYLYYQDHIIGSPFSYMYIAPGNVSYEQTSVVSTTPFSSNTAGVNNTIQVTAKDAFGHILDSDTANFTITNLDGITTISTWQGSGIYNVKFQAITKTTSTNGTNFSIQLGTPATDILGSPFVLHVGPSSTYSNNTVLTGPGLSSAVAGTQATFNLTAYDLYSNERELGTDTIAVRFTGTEAGKGTCSYRGSSGGVYDCEYTLTTTGSYTPIININSESAGNASALSTITVTAGTIHAPSCTFSGHSTTIVAGTAESYTIQARDQFSNALSTTSDAFVVTVTDDATSSTLADTVTSIGSGQYTVGFTPTVKGTYNVSIKLGGVDISGSSYAFTVTPGSVSATKCHVISDGTGGNGYKVATSNTQTSFTVQTRDANNNTLDSAMSGFSATSLICGATTINATCTYQSNGQYNCVYTPTTSGSTCSLIVNIGGTGIDSSPFTVNVSPGTIDADTTYVYGISDGTAGVESTFTVIAQDTNGNNLTGGGHSLSIYLTDLQVGLTDVTGSVTDNSDGSYTAAYTSTVSNIYESIKVSIFQVGGLLGNYYTDYQFTNVYANGQNIVDTTINFDWSTSVPITGFPSSDYFSVEWTGKLYPPYSETYTIYTPIYGGSGVKLYIGGTLVIDNFDPATGDTDPFTRIQLTANTYYDVILQFREQTGNAKVKLEWNSASIATRQVIPSTYLYYTKDISGVDYVGNVSINASTTVASACTASGNGLTAATAGSETTVNIIAKDAYSNTQMNAGNEQSSFNITLTSSNGTITVGTVTHAGNSGSDGLYTAKYNLTNVTGKYTLLLKYGGSTITTSSVTVSPNVVSGNSGTSSAVLSNGRAGELQTFTLYLRDKEGNLCQCGGSSNPVTISVNLTHSDSVTVITPTSIVDSDGGSGNGVGIFTITFNATKNGLYTPSISVGGTSITDVTSAINMTDAIASATYSYIHGWESGVSGTLTGGVYNQKTIQLQDIYQNNITKTGGYEFYSTLTNTSGSEISRGFLTSSANGLYTLNFSVPSASSYILNVKLASGDTGTPDGLTGQYFNNRWLYGTAINTKIDSNLSIDWTTGLVTTTAKDYVSVKWTGFIKPSYAEAYNFSITSDDGSRLYIDSVLLFDNFLSNAGSFNASHTFSKANLLYPITIDYRENTASASISLYWASASQSYGMVPQTAIFSSAAHIKSGPFTVTAV